MGSAASPIVHLCKQKQKPCVFYTHSQFTGQQENFFAKKQRVLNSFVVKSGALSLKNSLSFAELALVLEIFLLSFFYNFA